MKSLLLLTIIFLSACSSVASSTAALVVAMHAEKIEEDTRVYKHIDECFIDGEPAAFALADSIVFGTPISHEYQFILNPEKHDTDPAPPHHLAYALYIIAERIGDTRARARQKWLKPYLIEEEADDIKDFINRKYLQSYLTKCFTVPKNYKKRFRSREILER